MPELPEVETVANGLRKMFGSLKIIDVHCNRPNLRYPLAHNKLQKVCVGKQVKNIQRRGKYMIWEIGTKSFVLVHLGMSGSFCKVPGTAPLKKHQHVQFVLEDGTEVRYADSRRFGFILTEANASWQKHKMICHLGIEPWEKEKYKIVWNKIKVRSTPIKQCLMDQTVVVGIGNIYANEALFLAKIHPSLPVQKLNQKKWMILLEKSCLVLDKAIKKGGTTLSAGGFSDAEGNHGKFALDLNIYQKANKQCSVCNNIIQQYKLSGRSTYFCPDCQKLK